MSVARIELVSRAASQISDKSYFLSSERTQLESSSARVLLGSRFTAFWVWLGRVIGGGDPWTRFSARLTPNFPYVKLVILLCFWTGIKTSSGFLKRSLSTDSAFDISCSTISRVVLRWLSVVEEVRAKDLSKGKVCFLFDYFLLSFPATSIVLPLSWRDFFVLLMAFWVDLTF